MTRRPESDRILARTRVLDDFTGKLCYNTKRIKLILHLLISVKSVYNKNDYGKKAKEHEKSAPAKPQHSLPAVFGHKLAR